MAEPGWYHAEGDEPGTLRYWNGASWVGDPVPGNSPTGSSAGADSGATAATVAGAAPSGSQSHGGIVYYEASRTEVDLGDVARRVTLRDTETQHDGYVHSTARSPYNSAKSSVNVRRRPKLPEGLKNLAILVGVLKAIPLVGLAIGVVTVADDSTFVGNHLRRYAPPGLDFETGRGTAFVVMLIILLMTSGLLLAQARSALDDRAGDLFLAGLALLVIDLLSAVDQWFALASGQSIGATLLATLSLVLQAVITAWAATRAPRTT